MRRWMLLVVAAAGLALLAASCGGPGHGGSGSASTPTVPSDAAFNAADITTRKA